MSSTENEDQPFEILPGLPGTGPVPEYFGNGRERYREGLVVRFRSTATESWVGNFQLGDGGDSRVLIHPDGRTVVVIAYGFIYHIDPDSRLLLHMRCTNVDGYLYSPDRRLLVLIDWVVLWLIHADGRIIESDEVSYFVPAELCFSDRYLYGIATDYDGAELLPFAVDLGNGSVRGGALATPLSPKERKKTPHARRFSLVDFRDRHALRLLAIVVGLALLIIFLGRR